MARASTAAPKSASCNSLEVKDTARIEVIANGHTVAVSLPCTIESLLLEQGLPPRSVVVEHNGEAIPPSWFCTRTLQAGDRLEIVKIVAGG